MNMIIKFGEVSINKICIMCFWTSILFGIINSIMIGWIVYSNTYVNKAVNTANNLLIFREVNDMPLAMVVGIVCFIISIILSKAICEILFIILSYFKK